MVGSAGNIRVVLGVLGGVATVLHQQQVQGREGQEGSHQAGHHSAPGSEVHMGRVAAGEHQSRREPATASGESSWGCHPQPPELSHGWEELTGPPTILSLLQGSQGESDDAPRQ